MRLPPGTRVGHCEIRELIGQGGMGEVYRAHDSQLGRDVAIKVLPPDFVTDPDRLARFEREARLLASLNHPNIGAIYGVEALDGARALVLELIEGETLADRIARSGSTTRSDARRVSIGETLVIARQIAAAVEAAHDKGIIHRDLKPANIKITPAGVVKVLDFGLATSRVENHEVSETVTRDATQAGTVLGTAPYMSPEQARGQVVDRRTDIWAFGCVLFEMLTGTRPFAGATISDNIAAILEREPDWTKVPAETPAAIRTLLVRCLQKDVQKRLPHMGAARLELDDAIANKSIDAAPAVAGGGRSARVWPWAIAAAALLIAGAAVWAPWRAPAALPISRVTAEVGASVSLVTEGTTAGGAAAVISPDGAMLAFVGQSSDGRSQLYVRSLSDLRATAVANTNLARYPFFSPDGQWIGFFADGKLKKVSTAGGAVVPLADAENALGGSWSEDGTIAFVPGGKSGSNLMQIPAGGGKLATLVPLREGEITQRWPQFIAGGRSILFTSHSRIGGYNDAELVVYSLANGTRTVLAQRGYYARAVNGQLLFVKDATLFASRFDPGHPESVGEPLPLTGDLVAGPGTGAAQFDLSQSGTLVYLPKPDVAAPMQLMDRFGETTPLLQTPVNWSNPRVSPDGRRIAMSIADAGRSDIWIYEVSTGGLTRLTLDQSSTNPVWTPDGQRVTFASRRDGTTRNIYWQRADGTGEAQRLTVSGNQQQPDSWHPGGKVLALLENHQSSDIMMLPMEGSETSGWKPGTPVPFADGAAHELTASFSPDGRWVAYASNEGARFQIRVRPFIGGGGPWVVSAGIGNFPAWSRARAELFYSAPDDRRVMVVPFTVDGASFRAGKPAPWAQPRFVGRTGRPFDLMPDGDRVAVAKAPDEIDRNRVVLVFNQFPPRR